VLRRQLKKMRTCEDDMEMLSMLRAGCSVHELLQHIQMFVISYIHLHDWLLYRFQFHGSCKVSTNCVVIFNKSTLKEAVNPVPYRLPDDVGN
jgi:hypothetical protein